MQEATTFKPLYALTHAPIEAYFSKNSDDFVVREIPLYEFSGDGEHLIVEISKKDIMRPSRHIFLKIQMILSCARYRFMNLVATAST